MLVELTEFEIQLRNQILKNWKNYKLKRIDLGVARTKQQYDLAGKYICVEKISSADAAATIILNDKDNSELDLDDGVEIETLFKKVFITNEAQADEWIDIIFGADFKYKKKIEGIIPDIFDFDIFALARTIAPSGGQKLIYLDLTTYDEVDTNTEGTGAILQNLAVAYVTTGAANNSSARQNLSAQEVYDDDAVNITKCYTGGITGNCFALIGLLRSTLLTTQSVKEITVRHAAFIYEDGTWYCSVADGAAQTIESIAAISVTQILEIDGTEIGHIKFKVDGVVVKDFTTNLGLTYGYFQWYIHNKTTTADKRLHFYSYVYAGK